MILNEASDYSIGENANSSDDRSVNKFDHTIETKTHVRLRDYTVDERPNLSSILAFTKLNDLLHKSPGQRVTQS